MRRFVLVHETLLMKRVALGKISSSVHRSETAPRYMVIARRSWTTVDHCQPPESSRCLNHSMSAELGALRGGLSEGTIGRRADRTSLGRRCQSSSGLQVPAGVDMY